MAKVEITEWSELAIVEKLLCDYTQKTSERKDPRVPTGKKLLERVRAALSEATKEL